MIDIQEYMPTVGGTSGPGRRKIIEEGHETGKSFAQSDYPYAIVKDEAITRLAEKQEYHWYMSLAEIAKEYIAQKKEDFNPYWLRIWTDQADEIKRLYVAGFTSGYKEKVAELEEENEDQ